MKSYRNLNGPMLVAAAIIAVGVFLLLSLVAFKRIHYENPGAYELPALFFGVSALQFNCLGGASYFLVMIALAWAVVVFFRERDGEMLIRGAGTAVLICAAATLFALWGNDYLGGSLGAGIASVVKAFPGAIVGSVLMSAVFVVSFIVATDWLFYSALREAVSGPDLMRDAQTPAPLPSVFEREVLPAEPEPEVLVEAEPEDEAVVEIEEPTTEFADDPAESSAAAEVSAEAAPTSEEETEDRIVVPTPGQAATEAAVPPALRAVLGEGRGTIEVEPSDVQFADDPDAEALAETAGRVEPVAAVDPWMAPIAAPEETVAVEEETTPEGPEAEDPAEEKAPEAEVIAEAEAEETEALLEEEGGSPEATEREEVPPAFAPDRHVQVGHRGHQIAVEPSDVEFAEPDGAGDVVPVGTGPLPAIVEEEVFVDEEALSRMAPVYPSPADDMELVDESFSGAPEAADAVEENAEEPLPSAAPETLASMPTLIEERAGLRPEPEPEPDVAVMPEAHLGMVLQDEEIEWGSHEVAEDEAEPDAEVVEDEVIENPTAEQEMPPPEAEVPTEAIEDETPPESAAPDTATAKMTGLLDSLLGPAPNPYVEVEPETLVALIDDEEEDEAPVEATVELEETIAQAGPEISDVEIEPPTIDETVDEPPPQVIEEENPEAEDTPEEPPKAGPPAEASAEAGPPAETSAKAGLLSWFRRRRIEDIENDDRAAAAPVRPRRREPETPSLFDQDPAAASMTPDAELVDRAARLAIETGRASIVLFQRKLSIGYHRARALVDRLVAEGVLGPMGETGSHPVLLSEESWAGRETPVA